MKHYCVYHLSCMSSALSEVMLPGGIGQTLGYAVEPVFGYLASGFYSLSKEPLVVFEEAVQHILEQRRAFHTDQRERAENNMCARPPGSSFYNVDNIRLPDDALTEDITSLTKHLQECLVMEQRDYINITQGITLEVVEIINVKDSEWIDKAQRFLKDPERYLTWHASLDVQAANHQTRRTLGELQEYVKRRLTGNAEIQDLLNKAVFDLEQRFPVDLE